ncbi:MAG: hypothetical protein JO270_09315 [Acidobacteriaceae bacterium]|nr:hypothetical protein [Acidobacteriaceae bacterium]
MLLPKPLRCLPLANILSLLFVPFGLNAQTQVDASYQARNLPVYNVKSYGAKGNGSSDDTAALNAALSAVASHGGGYLFLPRGTYEISSEIVIPNGVQMVGLGWSNPPEYGQFGTVIQASANFSGNATFPGNMMLAIDGQSDTYGSGASNLTVDCNNVPGCGGLYRGHANEQTYFKRITVLNFSSYGLYVCGAGENGDAPHVCGGNSNNGSQGDGPDEDLQFLTGNSATANTLPVVLRNVLSYRGLHNVTINTSSSAPNQPQYGGWISGIGLNMRDIHMEGPANGFLLGPQAGSVCPKNCNGLTSADFNQIDLTRGGTSALILAGSYSLSLANILPNVSYQLNAQNTTSAGPIVWMAVDAHGNVASNDSNFGFNVGGNVTANQATIFSNTTPQLVLQNSTSPNYPFFGFNMEADGTLTLTAQGGTGNLLLPTADAVFGMGAVATLAGMNLQSPFDQGTGNTRGAVCSNAYWSSPNQNWQIGNNGGSDYACLYFPGTGGLAISASNAQNEPGTVPQSQFSANTGFYLAASGDLILGSGAVTASDTGQSLQIHGTMQLNSAGTQPTCSASLRGTFWFARAGTGAQDHVQVCAQNTSGALGWQQIY